MEIIITSILSFAATNIDDIFILALFYASHAYTEKEIIAGQLLGIASLITLSLAGSLIQLLLPLPYIGLLGLIPVFLGLRQLISLLTKDEMDEGTEIPEEKGQGAYKILSIAGITIANGGDNIGIYIPLFASQTWFSKTIMVLFFLSMTLVWCMLARYITKHPVVGKTIRKYGHVITPLVFLLLGAYILYENNSISLIY